MSYVPFIPKVGQIFFHATPFKFSSFKKQPTWFTPTQMEAREYVANQCIDKGQPFAYSKVCKFKSGKIADEKQALTIAKMVWPDDKYLMYSMFDEFVGEYNKEDIKMFITLLQKQKYVGAVHTDYSAVNNDRDSYTLVIFDPIKTMLIVDTWTYERKGDGWLDKGGKSHAWDEWTYNYGNCKHNYK